MVSITPIPAVPGCRESASVPKAVPFVSAL